MLTILGPHVTLMLTSLGPHVTPHAHQPWTPCVRQDEALLQTIGVNSPLRSTIIGQHMRFIEWPQLHGDANKVSVTCILTYLHTYLHTYLLTYLHTYLLTYTGTLTR